MKRCPLEPLQLHLGQWRPRKTGTPIQTGCPAETALERRENEHRRAGNPRSRVIPWAPYGVDVLRLGKFEERTKRGVAKNFIDDAGAAELHRVFQEHAFM
jgi:hypothetical protein